MDRKDMIKRKKAILKDCERRKKDLEGDIILFQNEMNNLLMLIEDLKNEIELLKRA